MDEALAILRRAADGREERQQRLLADGYPAYTTTPGCYVAVSGAMDNRAIEYVDHLHEHFVDPVVIRDGRYVAPTRPGFGATMRPETLAAYSYPNGPRWSRQR